ncbi:hypothetical protein PCK1_002785 [Pneumocystis canis]|nr:hypothetical protein PCK1_002785 [Pneumocystis canis]
MKWIKDLNLNFYLIDGCLNLVLEKIDIGKAENISVFFEKKQFSFNVFSPFIGSNDLNDILKCLNDLNFCCVSGALNDGLCKIFSRGGL